MVGEPNTIDGIKNKIRIIKEKGSENLKKEFDAEMKKFLDDGAVEWWKSPTTSPSEWWEWFNMTGSWRETEPQVDEI